MAIMLYGLAMDGVMGMMGSASSAGHRAAHAA
jgi:hypothetical protein